MIKLLLEQESIEPAAGIATACQQKDVKSLKMLLADPRTDPSFHNSTVIPRCALDGSTSCMQWLLYDERVDPSVDSNCAVGNALANLDEEMMAVLLADKRVDPSVCCASHWGYSIRYRNEYGNEEAGALLAFVLRKCSFEYSYSKMEFFDGHCYDYYGNNYVNWRATLLVQERVELSLTLFRLLLPPPVVAEIAWMGFGYTGKITASRMEETPFKTAFAALMQNVYGLFESSRNPKR